MAKELLERRSYNQKHFDNEDGTFTLETHSGHIHYKDEQGNFVDSNIKPEDKGLYYEITKHNYHLRVFKDFAAPTLIRYTNRYEGANHTITYEPFAIAWFRPEDKDLQIFRNQKSVQGIYKSENNSIYYTGAFGNGIDFEVSFCRSGFKKEVIIPSKPNTFPAAPSSKHRLVVLFKYGGDGLKISNDKQEEWDKESWFDNQGVFEVFEEANPSNKSFVRPAYAVDSSKPEKVIPLRVAWVRRGGSLWQAKEIPLNSFQNATFPVRFDTVTDYYPHSSDGSIYVSGGSWSSSTWNTVRSATSGTVRTGTLMASSIIARASITYLERLFLSFDTSSIGDTDTIDSASLFLYTQSQNVAKSGSNNTQNVVAGTQASDTALVGGDFDQVGSTSFSSVSFPHTYNSWVEFVFNTSGKNHINKTGYTKLAVRMGDDLDNYYNSSLLDQDGYFSTTETAFDPYLRVTYSSAGTPRRIFNIT